MKRRLAVLGVALVVAVGPACGGNSSHASEPSGAGPSSNLAPDAQVVSPDEFSAFIDANPDVPLVNVHIPYEGHIDGTDSFVPFDQVASWDGLPADKDAPIAIYCRSGNMTVTAAATLAELGYTDVTDLAGGMRAWADAGYDLRTDGDAGS